MEWLKTISDFYISGHYTKADVAKFVKFKKIKAKDYKDITGDKYVAE
jgi:uncharacterized XkdX family phage protein